MRNEAPTYVFRDDKVYAVLNGKVIASGDDIDSVERIASAAECPTCGGTPPCEDCGGEKKTAKKIRIVTPNGLKGQILNRHKGLWGDEVAVRLENGKVAHFQVTSEEDLKPDPDEEEEKKNPFEELKEKLEKETAHTKTDLGLRQLELDQIKSKAASYIRSGISDSDREELHRMVLQADYESEEIAEVLESIELDENEAYAPPAPFRTDVSEQAEVGAQTTWLDDTYDAMMEEHQEEDYDKLMDEGPEMFLTDLDTPVLEEPEAVQELATEFVASKVAGFNNRSSSQFTDEFLQRTEVARRIELARRMEEQPKPSTTKEASFDADSVPDEGLFW